MLMQKDETTETTKEGEDQAAPWIFNKTDGQTPETTDTSQKTPALNKGTPDCHRNCIKNIQEDWAITATVGCPLYSLYST